MRASDIMHRAVIVIAQDATIYQAARLMSAHRISGLVVVDNAGTAVGMLTESDLLRRAELGTEPRHSALLAFLRGPAREAADYLRTHARIVADVMHKPVLAVRPDASLDEVVAVMEKNKIRRLPVVEDGKPVGVISRADLLAALEPLLAAGDEAANLTDSDIQAALIKALNQQPWVPPGLSVDVRNGVATIYGVVSDPREERAVEVLAENVTGVKSVRNQLTFVDVNSGMAITGLG